MFQITTLYLNILKSASFRFIINIVLQINILIFGFLKLAPTVHCQEPSASKNSPDAVGSDAVAESYFWWWDTKTAIAVTVVVLSFVVVIYMNSYYNDHYQTYYQGLYLEAEKDLEETNRQAVNLSYKEGLEHGYDLAVHELSEELNEIDSASNVDYNDLF